MKKPGLFDKENYKTGKIIHACSKIPLAQAHFVLLFGVFIGGPCVLISLFYILNKAASAAVPEDIITAIVFLFVGGFLVLMGLSLSHIVYLSVEVEKLKAAEKVE